MDPAILARVDENLRDKGLPLSNLYRQAEVSRLLGERLVAEPDQLTRFVERGARGQFTGRKSGAVDTTQALKATGPHEEE